MFYFQRMMIKASLVAATAGMGGFLAAEGSTEVHFQNGLNEDVHIVFDKNDRMDPTFEFLKPESRQVV